MSIRTRGSVLRKRCTSCQAEGARTTVSSPCWACEERTAAGKVCRTRSTRCCAMGSSCSGSGFLVAAQRHHAHVLIRGGIAAWFDDARRPVTALDLVLEQHEPIEHALGPWRTAGDVDVARDDLVDPGHTR